MLTELSSVSSLQSAAVKCFMPGMGKELGRRIKDSRLGAGITSKAELGRKMGVVRQTVTLWESGKAEPTSDNLRKLSVILDVGYDWLATGRSARPGVVLGLELHGEVAGGVWIEHPESQDMEFERVPVAPDPNYPIESQYALRVRGNSVNKTARDGSIVICVDVIAAGIEIRDKDLVVVERRRGSIVETTIKRVRKGNGGLELWPESDDPSHQEKLTLGPRRGGVEVSIKALVIWTANPVVRGV